MTLRSRTILAASTFLCGLAATSGAAHAANPSIDGIEQQIRSLQNELSKVKTDLARRRAETARAQAAANQAREEAREANRRASEATVAGSQSFQGAPSGSLFGGPTSRYPGTFAAQDLPNNGIGPHEGHSVGQQQASALGKYGKFRIGGVTVTLGGFLAAEEVTRQRNIVADIGSSYNAIPYENSPLYHEPEYRGSARQSRIALLIEGAPSVDTRVAGYFATDFLSSGVSSNSNESNSYSLRVREAYATFDQLPLGFHMLAGQSWSLLTLNRVGITPRQENIPLTIDAQYVVGFNWARQEQLRFVKDFNKRVWLGLSFEEPETTYGVATQNVAGTNNVGGVVGGTVNYANPGGSLLNSTASYSADIAPDVVAKLAFDPSFGHYELDGLARFENTRYTSTVLVNQGRNRTALAGGVGAGMLLPVIGKALLFQASGLIGQGIGRYGSGQLPDATINSNGTPIPIPEAEALLGLIGHPIKTVDLYAYVGAEGQRKVSFNERIGGTIYPFGYGNGRVNLAGCAVEGGSCAAQTGSLVEGTLGAWWRFAHGDWGTLQAGTQWEYFRKTAFQGIATSTVGRRTVTTQFTPSTDDNMVLFSFRYLPFQ